MDHHSPYRVCIIVDGQASLPSYHQLFHEIRTQINCTSLVALMLGAFSSKALPFSASASERASVLYDAGADLVIEIPTICTLLSSDVAAFSYSSLILRTGMADGIILPCESGEESVIRKAADLLFFEPLPYQRAMKSLRSKGFSLEDNQFSAMEPFLETDSAPLKKSYAASSAYMLCALRKTYSLVKPLFLPVSSSLLTALYPENTAVSSVSETQIADKSRSLLIHSSDVSFLWEQVKDFYGSDRSMTEVLFAAASDPSCRTLSALSEASSLLSSSQPLPHTPREFRRYLLYLLGGFRFTLNSILALHSYVPYIHVITSQKTDRRLIDLIQKADWAPLLEDSGEGISRKSFLSLEESIQHLYSMDAFFHTL